MKPFTILAIVVFVLVGLIHFLRYLLGWKVIIGSTVIPVWISPPAAVIAVFLAYMLWREMKK